MNLPTTSVAVNIVRASDGRVLMAERTPRQIAAGFWELPGGKIDPGESPEQAAYRELHEEIGIRAVALRPWLRYRHAFRTRIVDLHFFQVDDWTGQVHGREGQALAWVDPAAIHVGPVLPSQHRVLTGLALPPWVVELNGDAGWETGLVEEKLSAALGGGARLIQLRAPRLTPDQRIALARRVNRAASAAGARVLLEGTALEVLRAGVAGMHSRVRTLERLPARPSVPLWSVSCHGAVDLERAMALGADFVLLSPILPVPEDPDRQPLGWLELERLARRATVPVFAHGGLTPLMLERARRAGAAGIATGALTTPDF